MEGGLVYHITASCFLVSIGLYHIYSATRNHFNHFYSAKPYHPFPCSSSSSSSMMCLRHIELYLSISFLTLSLFHQLVLSFQSDPLLEGDVHPFSSLQSAAVILLFLLLSLSLLLLPLPPDLVFALASSAFFLASSVSSSLSASPGLGRLQSRCESLSADVSALSSVLCLALAFSPRLFVAELGLGASVCLQGLWALQTGLSLHADAFIPLGCHKLLDVGKGVQGSTKCDLDESGLRAVALMDLMFAVHVVIVVVLVVLVYAVVARKNNNNGAHYEPLPTANNVAACSGGSAGNVISADSSHIQMKAMAGTQA